MQQWSSVFFFVNFFMASLKSGLHLCLNAAKQCHVELFVLKITKTD